MPDSAVGSLPAVQLMQAADLFVLEQNGEAKKLSGELLSSFIDRKITSVTVVERAATATYTASYNKNTGALTLGIPRGVGIASISNPVVSGLNKTYTITFDKPASASVATKKTFTVKDGNAITGIQAVSAPHTPGTRDRYQISFSEGEPFVFEVYNGQDGYGSAGTSVPLPNNTNGSVGTSGSFSREDHQHPLPVASDIVMQRGSTVENAVADLQTYEPIYLSGTISANQMYLTDNRITADMRVTWSNIGTPANVKSALNWTTAAGSITFTGTLSGSTTIALILAKTN